MPLWQRILRRLMLRLAPGGAPVRQLLLFVAIAVGLAVILTRGSQPYGGTPAPSPAEEGPPTITARAGSPEAAVQSVILRTNQQQERAIASRDSSVMRDTSTDGYYQEIARINQEMLSNGVKAIKLLKLEWGEITINGNTAMATTWETWRTELADGRVGETRDRNVYTVIQAGGDWKIQSDDHPEEGPSFPRFF